MPPNPAAIAELIREIEVERGRMNTHEGICAERYKRIDEKLDAIPAEHTAIRLAIAGLEAAVKKVSDGANQTAWKANWKAWSFAGAAFVGLVGLLGRVSYLLYVAPLLAGAHIAGH